MDTDESFALIWHKDTKGMISEAQNDGIFIEKVKHVKYCRVRTNQNNCYFSVNSFITRRAKCNIFELVGISVDIDFDYYAGVDAENVVRLIEDQEYFFNLPTPSFINDSGNGLHMYWKYEKPIPARTKTNQVKEKLIFLHEKITRTFAEILSDYGADKQATDITRLLRDTGTFNTKGGERKRVYTIRNYGISYSLEELQQWLPKLEQKKKNIKKAVSNTKNDKNRYTLHIARLKDILKLADLRSYDCIGYRELMCFLTRYYSYLSSGDKEKAKETMLELNNNFKDKLRENRLIMGTKSAEKAVEKYLLDKAKGYNYSNKRLIEILNISEDEQRQLSSIISVKEKYDRNNDRRNEQRRNEDGLTTREQKKQELIKHVCELKEKGIKNEEIAKRLSISRQYVYQVLGKKGKN